MPRNNLNRIPLGLVLAACLTAGGALAQDAKAPAHNPQVDQRPEVIVSPEIGADGRVTFRIKAPKASEVLLNASIGDKTPKPPGTVKDAPDQWNVPMQKGGGVLFARGSKDLSPASFLKLRFKRPLAEKSLREKRFQL